MIDVMVISYPEGLRRCKDIIGYGIVVVIMRSSGVVLPETALTFSAGRGGEHVPRLFLVAGELI